MTSEMMIAVFAGLVFGTAIAAVAIINYEVNASLAAFAPKSALTAAYVQNWVVGHDASGAVIFRGPLPRTCTPAMKQYSRC
jgi:hypothetical protein